MTSPSDRSYVPPTASAPPAGAVALPAGYAPPPGYVPVMRTRPPQLGLASGCTIAVGVLALLGGVLLLIAGFIASYWIDFGLSFARPWAPTPSSSAIVGTIFLVALVPIAFGAFALYAGREIAAGQPSGWTMGIVAHALNVVLGLAGLAAAGLGLLFLALSGVALYALFQPDVRAYFGH